jgi:hypothetical protein
VNCEALYFIKTSGRCTGRFLLKSENWLKNYELLKENPRHPSLQLKRIEELWSVRVGKHYRAIGIDAPGGIQWIWIGSHNEYDKFIA